MSIISATVFEKVHNDKVSCFCKKVNNKDAIGMIYNYNILWYILSVCAKNCAITEQG